MPQDDTLPEEDLPSDRRTRLHVPALVIAWCADAPERVGEAALLDSTPRILGRGDTSPGDALPRLIFGRERGGAFEPAAALSSPHLSRDQLRARALGGGRVEVENVGRLPLIARGSSAGPVIAGEGEVLQLGAQLLLVVAMRPSHHAGRSRATFPFGDADPHGIVGESRAAWALRDAIVWTAAREGHVLVRGESGTGKELVCRAIHMSSARANGPLVARNAATFPETLIDAELFGNARSFPNVGMPERPGLIGEADGGTLFLDEFAELPAAMQAHLLRVLDSGEYQRLGEPRVRRSSFRLVAATNRPLVTLKHDVLARLVHRVDVPPLRARREDVPLVTRHLLRRIAQEGGGSDAARRARADLPLSSALVRAVLERPLETNVRELEAILWRALAAGEGGELGLAVEDETPSSQPASAVPARSPVEKEAKRIQRCLDENNGALEPARRALGLPSRHALARLIKKHGLEVRRRTR